MTVFVARKPILHNVAGKADFTLNPIDRAVSQITHLPFLCLATADRQVAKQNISVYQLMASSVGRLIMRSLSERFAGQRDTPGLAYLIKHLTLSDHNVGPSDIMIFLFPTLFLIFNPYQSNFSATLILPSSYLFWARKRLVGYL
jgi:hypothetical protein